jgi:hypothetical protein
MHTAAIFVFLMAPLLAQPKDSTPDNSGDFYLVSSVDLARRQILLKRPTEVTELMRVDGETRYFDERGKAIKLTDLRAGDTVYITSARNGDQPVATAIRKGPMTLDVLHERYLKSKR